ncbi:hypothetical protein MPNT_160064 [Candidatus Methylacidithermus pantelleriae]|uniref:Uncharacterized protein n=1 Tax=Candidatus Methylacidithermus pantelleriae TaxID=2744239 RepID=A0A8J2BS88_9BACT|nr:hypothetical protein MPNT_160064 [Candidatus Methylacidithermus pantelleriae]
MPAGSGTVKSLHGTFLSSGIGLGVEWVSAFLFLAKSE